VRPTPSFRRSCKEEVRRRRSRQALHLLVGRILTTGRRLVLVDGNASITTTTTASQLVILRSTETMSSACAPKRGSRWRLIANLAIGLVALGVIGWWMLSTFTEAKESRRAVLLEWSSVQAAVDKRWSRLRELHEAFDPTVSGGSLSQAETAKFLFDYQSPPVFLPGTPQYTFSAYEKWNGKAGLPERIELVRSIEGSMSEFLKALEAEPRVKTNVALSELHREIAVTQNEFQQSVARYNSAAMNYNALLASFPRSLWLRRLDFRLLPTF